MECLVCFVETSLLLKLENKKTELIARKDSLLSDKTRIRANQNTNEANVSKLQSEIDFCENKVREARAVMERYTQKKDELTRDFAVESKKGLTLQREMTRINDEVVSVSERIAHVKREISSFNRRNY